MTEEITVLDLFSGIGGFSLGLERTGGFRTVAFCESNKFARQVIRRHWPDVPIFTDVGALTSDDIPWPVDLVCGGPPCQPVSHAGERSGEADDRWLWPEMHRIVDTVRPSWVCVENVVGLISLGLDQMLSDLEGIGYTTTALSIPACAVDARHRRERCFVLAHAGGERLSIPKCETSPRTPAGQDNVGRTATECHRWPTEPGMDRMAHGVPSRVDRLRSLGNAVVPAVVEQIGRAILEGQRR